jgi:tetratricopeptide (TPR) repeat protein
MSNVINNEDVFAQFNHSPFYAPVTFVINGNELGAWLTKKAPKEPPFFAASRDTELHAMHQTLFEQQNDLLLLSGLGGVGKSALAAAYLQRHGKAYHHLAWLPVNDTPKQAMLNLAPAFGLNIRDFGDSEALFEAICRALVNVLGRNLMVFDDVAAPKPFELPNLAPTWTILLTSRMMQPQIGWTIQKLGVLAPAAAERLFVEFAPSAKTERTILQRLLQCIDYHTLLVKMLAKNYQQIRQADAQYRLQDLYDALAQHGLLKLGNDHSDAIDDPDYKGLNPQTVENIVRFMYQRQQLSAAQETCLFRIAFLPPQFMPFEHLLALCHDVAEPNKKMIKNYCHALKELAKIGWLEMEIADNEQIIFRMHQIIQLIMLEISQTEENTKLPLKRLNDVLEQYKMPLHQQSDFAYYGAYMVQQLTLLSYSKGSLLCNLCDFHLAIGQLDDAENFASMCYKLSQLRNDSYRISVGLDRLGRIHRLQGNLSKALDYFEKAKILVESELTKNPQSDRFKNGLAVVYERFGEIYQAQGDLSKALDYFEKRYRLNKSLVAKHPNSEAFKNSLAMAYEKLGEIYQDLGDLPKALDYFEKQYRLNKLLVDNNPQSQRFKNSLAIAYFKLGYNHKAQGNLSEALSYFEKDLAIIESLVAKNPKSEKLKHDLAVSYGNVGSIYREQGDSTKALNYFEKDLAIIESLVAKNPKSEKLKHDLAVSYGNVGSIYREQGDSTKALNYFEKDLAIAESLYHKNPHSESLKNGLAIVCCKIGGIKMSNGHSEQAINLFKKAKIIWQALSERTEISTYKEHLQVAQDGLDALQPLKSNIISKIWRYIVHKIL